jgi:hypothetical protein
MFGTLLAILHGVVGTIRSRRNRTIENLALRQQIAIRRCTVRRPELDTGSDRQEARICRRDERRLPETQVPQNRARSSRRRERERPHSARANPALLDNCFQHGSRGGRSTARAQRLLEAALNPGLGIPEGQRDFFDQHPARRVEELALPERQLLPRSQPEQIAQHPSHILR